MYNNGDDEDIVVEGKGRRDKVIILIILMCVFRGIKSELKGPQIFMYFHR